MTENHHVVTLNDRTLVTIGGPDVARFLQGIITTDVEHIGNGDMLPGALLSPQGKVLFDFLIGRRDGLFFIDIRRMMTAAFIRRLSLYRLRADIQIHEENQNIVDIFLNMATPCANHGPEDGGNKLTFNDKRIMNEYNYIRMYRIESRNQPAVSHRQKWDIIRIENGIAESGTDFELGDVFPHDINYDQINGLSFKKSCYIGQEVVSRMQHRGTARRRVLVAAGTAPLSPAGSAIEAEGKPIGTLGTVAGTKALALARTDRVSAMMKTGAPITACGISLTLSVPAHVHFSLSGHPEEK